jgi:hypothetical protein
MQARLETALTGGVEHLPRAGTIAHMPRGETFPPAPLNVCSSGAPQFGTYEGTIPSIDFSQLRGIWRESPLERFRKHKRWVYSFVATPDVAACFAIVDLGYATHAFTAAVDLHTRLTLANDGFLGLPRATGYVGNQPGAGLDARFQRPDVSLQARRNRGDSRVLVDLRLGLSMPLLPARLRAQWELRTSEAGPPVSVISPVEGGVVNFTQKWAGLEIGGTLEANGRRYSLEGGTGGLDYTNGYLARRTAWRWAFICGRLDDGRRVGLNLVEGFNEARDDVNENALWLDGEAMPVGRARFLWTPSDVLAPWTVHTTDGALDLSFSPIMKHAENRNLRVVSSRFVQCLGTWSGVVTVGGQRLHLRNAPGVTEDQSVVW